jgi:hypothetical protein
MAALGNNGHDLGLRGGGRFKLGDKKMMYGAVTADLVIKNNT